MPFGHVGRLLRILYFYITVNEAVLLPNFRDGTIVRRNSRGKRQRDDFLRPRTQQDNVGISML